MALFNFVHKRQNADLIRYHNRVLLNLVCLFCCTVELFI